jgi:hypothetical protein
MDTAPVIKQIKSKARYTLNNMRLIEVKPIQKKFSLEALIHLINLVFPNLSLHKKAIVNKVYNKTFMRDKIKARFCRIMFESLNK